MSSKPVSEMTEAEAKMAVVALRFSGEQKDLKIARYEEIFKNMKDGKYGHLSQNYQYEAGRAVNGQS